MYGTPIQIRVMDDGITISNSCILPEGWTVDTLMEPHESKPRQIKSPMPFPEGGSEMIQNNENKTSDLKKIPGVGVDMEQHLKNIGIHCISDLRGKDPEELYRLDCIKKGFQDDRCMLYVFRCAVYFAEHEQHEPEKLKWWYWKDKDYPERCENQ